MFQIHRRTQLINRIDKENCFGKQQRFSWEILPLTTYNSDSWDFDSQHLALSCLRTRRVPLLCFWLLLEPHIVGLLNKGLLPQVPKEHVKKFPAWCHGLLLGLGSLASAHETCIFLYQFKCSTLSTRYFQIPVEAFEDNFPFSFHLPSSLPPFLPYWLPLSPTSFPPPLSPLLFPLFFCSSGVVGDIQVWFEFDIFLP